MFPSVMFPSITSRRSRFRRSCLGCGADGEPEPIAEEDGLPHGVSDAVPESRVPVHAREPDAEGLEQLQHARGRRGAHRPVQAW